MLPSSPSHQLERHYRVVEVAKMIALSSDKVRRLFEHEPGVVVLGSRKPGRRIYRTLLIPHSVLVRVLRLNTIG